MQFRIYCFRNEISFPVSAICIFLLRCFKARLMLTSRGRYMQLYCYMNIVVFDGHVLNSFFITRHTTGRII